MSKEAKSYMQVALEQAERAGVAGEVPVGAVLVESFSGKIVAAAGNRVEELHDPTAHAEMLVLRLGGQRLCASRLPVCDLYVTLEPCPMCAGALVQARMGRVVYGASDPKRGALGSCLHLGESSTAHHHLEVIGGVLAEPCRQQLQSWFRQRRTGGKQAAPSPAD